MRRPFNTIVPAAQASASMPVAESVRERIGVSTSANLLHTSSYSPVHTGQEDPFNAIAETDLEYLDISPKAIIDIKKALKSKDCTILRRCILNDESPHYERLMLYRLRAHKLSTRTQGESRQTISRTTTSR
jgi:hypothetical protein